MRRFIFAIVLTASTAHAQTPERFSVVAEAETVGHVQVERRGNQVDVDYAVLENGRGPKHREHLVLAPSGIPTTWTIEGTSLMGATVNERLTWQDGTESWVSQADRGEMPEAAPRLYIADDASPWALGLYASILRKAPGGSLDVLPSGRLRAQKVRRLAAGTVGFQAPLDAYVLTGVELTPQFVLLDAQGRLFAVLSGTVVVREGFEKEFKALRALGESLTVDLLRAMQEKVAHHYDVPVRIRNVRLFEPQSLSLSEPESLVFYRGSITTVEKEAAAAVPPADEVLIDGQGGTLIAGLHDMHSHNSLWSGPFYLAAGVTTTRDMGNNNSFLLDLMPRLDSGELRRTAHHPVRLPRGPQSLLGAQRIIAETLEEGLATCTGMPTAAISRSRSTTP